MRGVYAVKNYITHGLWLANMHAECRTEVSENELRAHLMKAVARTHELAKQRDQLEKLGRYIDAQRKVEGARTMTVEQETNNAFARSRFPDGLERTLLKGRK